MYGYINIGSIAFSCTTGVMLASIDADVNQEEEAVVKQEEAGVKQQEEEEAVTTTTFSMDVTVPSSNETDL